MTNEERARIEAAIGWLQNELETPDDSDRKTDIDTAMRGARNWSNDTWENYQS